MSSFTRAAARLLIPTLIGAGALFAPSVTPVAHAITCNPNNTTRGDIDSDGVADVINGDPYASGGGKVTVYRSGGGTITVNFASLGFSATGNDRLGTSIATGDLNADGCDDLVIGAPGRGSGGAVVIAISQGSSFVGQDIINGTQADEELGRSVTVLSPLKGPSVGGFSTIVAGAPFRDVGSAIDAGAIVAYHYSRGLVVTGTSVITQNTPNIAGTAEGGDVFGLGLASWGKTIVVGTPHEDVGTARDAGNVTLITPGGSWGTWYGKGIDQNTSGVPDTAQSYDVFGWSVAIVGSRLVVGAPGESIGGVSHTGLVHQFTWNESTRSLISRPAFHQNSSYVPGSNEVGDYFGWAVAIVRGGLNPGKTAIAVGAPFEDVGSVPDAGAVTLVQSNSYGTLSAGKSFSQGAGVLGGTAEAEDYFGLTLAAPRGDEASSTTPDALVAGAPGEDLAVGLDAGQIFLTRNRATSWTVTSGSAANQRLGNVLADGSMAMI